MPAEPLIFVVDRIEGSVVVLEGDDGRRLEVDRGKLRSAREGMVYRVPVSPKGTPRWAKARADEAESERRRKALGDRMQRLRDSDPGGDMKL